MRNGMPACTSKERDDVGRRVLPASAALAEADFGKISLRAEVPRQGASVPVAGWLVTARRS